MLRGYVPKLLLHFEGRFSHARRLSFLASRVRFVVVVHNWISLSQLSTTFNNKHSFSRWNGSITYPSRRERCGIILWRQKNNSKPWRKTVLQYHLFGSVATVRWVVFRPTGALTGFDIHSITMKSGRAGPRKLDSESQEHAQKIREAFAILTQGVEMIHYDTKHAVPIKKKRIVWMVRQHGNSCKLRTGFPGALSQMLC